MRSEKEFQIWLSISRIKIREVSLIVETLGIKILVYNNDTMGPEVH